jgi:hypothetical protein
MFDPSFAVHGPARGTIDVTPSRRRRSSDGVSGVDLTKR